MALTNWHNTCLLQIKPTRQWLNFSYDTSYTLWTMVSFFVVSNHYTWMAIQILIRQAIMIIVLLFQHMFSSLGEIQFLNALKVTDCCSLPTKTNYHSIASVAIEITWITNLLHELSIPLFPSLLTFFVVTCINITYLYPNAIFHSKNEAYYFGLSFYVGHSYYWFSPCYSHVH